MVINRDKLHLTLYKRIKSNFLSLSILFVFSLILTQMTHFGYLSNGSYGHDAGIFSYTGYAMLKGRALYTQTYENKGPLLYLINMLGVYINYYHGLYLIELITLFVTILFAYKTALFITDQKKPISVLSSIFSMLLLVVALQGGNLCEEYALPFITIALYYVTKFFYSNMNLMNYEIILIGMCFAAVFWLRANICAFFIPMILIIVIVLVKQKDWKLLIKATSYTFLGIIIFSIPILIYLIKNGTFRECINVAYLNALGDFSSITIITRIQNVYRMINQMADTGALYAIIVFIIAYLICLAKSAFNSKRIQYMLSICFLGLLINLLANSISGANHMHYFITFVPIIIIPTAWLLYSLHSFITGVTKKEYAGFIGVSAIFIYITFHGFALMGDGVIKNSTVFNPENYVTPEVEYIIYNSEDTDFVQVIGGSVTLNYRAKRLSASKHVHFASGRFSDEVVTKVANEIAYDIIENEPKLILFGTDEDYNKFSKALTSTSIDSILEGKYKEQFVDIGYIVYMKIPTVTGS